MLEWCWQDIRFRLSLWFPATVIVMLSVDHTGLTVICLLASILHELGHFLVMALFRDAPACITLGLFGMRVERHPTVRLSYPALCAVSLAGPLVNGLCCALLWYTGRYDAALIHGVLAFFNLLPITSLDGGEAVYALLCCRLTEQRAEWVLLICSVVTVFPLAILGFWLLIESGYNFTLLIVSVYLILRMFLRSGH